MPESDAKAMKLEQDAVVTALVPDPSELPPDVTVLRGFVGETLADGGTIRFYLTASLKNYVEIPTEQILHSHQLDDEQGTLVWLNSSLILKLVEIASSEEIQAQFLVGPISGTNLGPPLVRPPTRIKEFTGLPFCP
jgi:hypothetical protein